jgi:hypothetical protein
LEQAQLFSEYFLPRRTDAVHSSKISVFISHNWLLAAIEGDTT